MEKINQGHPMSQSPDFVKDNIELLKSLFPTIVKEGKIVMEELEALLGEDVEKEDEHYNFTWAGKSLARREANKPSTATLRPDKSESKDWDKTGNIFIEGDNLEVLKLLQKSYANKIKMIYIDPPYNTGKDFVYKDNYQDNLSNYLSITGQFDEEGKKTSTNSESDGRYHSNWLNMMYPRLKLARNLLTNDGVVIVSIDNNEVENLKKICSEIFGDNNHVETIVWKKKYGGGAKTKYYVGLHEYIVVFAKNISAIDSINVPYEQHTIDKYYKYKDEQYSLRGPYRLQPLSTNSNDFRSNLRYPIIHQGQEVWPEKQWQWSKERTDKAISNKEIVFIETKGRISVNFKQYLKGEDGEMRESKPVSIIEGIYTQHGTNEIKELFGDGQVFSFPKPSNLIKTLASAYLKNEDIFLDFFSGSSSSAHAIMKLNSQDFGNRKFINVQIPELTNEQSEAFKAGYKNICNIGKERIRRAGEKILAKKRVELEQIKSQSSLFQAEEENKKIGGIVDIGFKVFKLDSSNIKSWNGNPEKLEENLFTAGKNIKEDRTEEDVLFEILLKYGLDLTVPIEKKSVNGKMVYSIGFGTLFICLSDNITTEVADAIGQWKEELEPPTSRVIFKDSGFNDVQKTNSIQILKRFGINEVNTI